MTTLTWTDDLALGQPRMDATHVAFVERLAALEHASEASLRTEIADITSEALAEMSVALNKDDRATLNQAEGELAHARATLTLKQQNLARKTALFPVNAVSKFDLDVANARPPGACVGGYGIGWLDWEGTGRLTRMLLFVL